MILNKKFKSPFLGAIAGLGAGLIGVYVAGQISKYVFGIPSKISSLEGIWLVVLGILIITTSLLLNKKQ